MEKHVKLFYLKSCPYCRQAFEFIDELKRQDVYKNIEIETIEESEQPAIAERYDYYYVPTFYVNEEKRHEGAVTRGQVETVFREALSSAGAGRQVFTAKEVRNVSPRNGQE
ncbi:MAG: thioredoxin family protein [Tannerella sp.]|nr:thioredoxin family protein [Tannerella sp.]